MHSSVHVRTGAGMIPKIVCTSCFQLSSKLPMRRCLWDFTDPKFAVFL